MFPTVCYFEKDHIYEITALFNLIDFLNFIICKLEWVRVKIKGRVGPFKERRNILLS
jgi:hypothetical protein